MNCITDTAGRTWHVAINVATISRVRKALGINLLELVLPESTLSEQFLDVEALVNLLYVLCQDQCLERDVSDEQFGAGLSRDNIEDGFDAVLEGVVNFSPRGLRPALAKALAKSHQIRQRYLARMETMVSDPSLDAAMEEAANRVTVIPVTRPTGSWTAATSSAGSPASTPDNTRSAS